MVKTKGQIQAFAELIGAQTDFIAQRVTDAEIERVHMVFVDGQTLVSAFEKMKDGCRARHCFVIDGRKMQGYEFDIMDEDGNVLA